MESIRLGEPPAIVRARMKQIVSWVTANPLVESNDAPGTDSTGLLHDAALWGHTLKVKSLLDAESAHVDDFAPGTKETALEWAAGEGQHDTVRLLLDRGATVGLHKASEAAKRGQYLRVVAMLEKARKKQGQGRKADLPSDDNTQRGELADARESEGRAKGRETLLSTELAVAKNRIFQVEEALKAAEARIVELEEQARARDAAAYSYAASPSQVDSVAGRGHDSTTPGLVERLKAAGCGEHLQDAERWCHENSLLSIDGLGEPQLFHPFAGSLNLTPGQRERLEQELRLAAVEHRIDTLSKRRKGPESHQGGASQHALRNRNSLDARELTSPLQFAVAEPASPCRPNISLSTDPEGNKSCLVQ